jgi:hypothetical protein
LVEFAIVAPLLFLLLFGVIEFARLITTYVSVSTASREGARYATAVGDDGGTLRYLNCAGIEAAVQAKIPAVAIDPNTDLEILYDSGTVGDEIWDCAAGNPSPSDIPSGSRVVVTVSRTFNAVAPIISIFLDGIPIESTDRRTIFVGELSG